MSNHIQRFLTSLNRIQMQISDGDDEGKLGTDKPNYYSGSEPKLRCTYPNVYLIYELLEHVKV